MGLKKHARQLAKKKIDGLFWARQAWARAVGCAGLNKKKGARHGTAREPSWALV